VTILRDTAGSIRPAVAFAFAGLAIVAVATTAVAVGGRNGATPSSSDGPPSTPAASASAPASIGPSTRPVVTPAPTTRPTTEPTASPTHANAEADAMPIKVDLRTTDGHAVYVDVADQTGLLESAVSGTPGDGASAEGLAVENVDARTLHLTWVDFPIDNADALYIEWFDGHLRLLLVQPEPRGDTDAIGFDRELILTFSEPISAADVEAHLTTGLDTTG
jgi:hypothetical protein